MNLPDMLPIDHQPLFVAIGLYNSVYESKPTLAAVHLGGVTERSIVELQPIWWVAVRRSAALRRGEAGKPAQAARLAKSGD
jgi:hypothetical protein